MTIRNRVLLILFLLCVGGYTSAYVFNQVHGWLGVGVGLAVIGVIGSQVEKIFHTNQIE